MCSVDPSSDTTGHVLAALGFCATWQALFQPHVDAGLLPGRVVRADRGSCVVAWVGGFARAQFSARFVKAASTAIDLPAAGDWVTLSGVLAGEEEPAIFIEGVLPRRTAFIRSDPGKEASGQVLAANIDVVLVVHSLEAAPNLRRIERELAVAWESGATPVVVLTKADLAPDPAFHVPLVSAVAPEVEVLLVSAVTGLGLDALLSFCGHNRTVALIGPSGSGKSTLINSMIGEERQATCQVRVADGKGRHTTVARELVPVPGGGVLVDTPGLRALALWEAGEGIGRVFPDIEELAGSCRFADCAHAREPGCAVLAAVERGEVAVERLESYRKLLQESARVTRLRNARRPPEGKRKWKSRSKDARAFHRLTGR